MAEALVLLGARRGVVVHGRDGLDEVTLTGPTDVAEAAEGQVRRFSWTPADFGLATSDVPSGGTGKMPVPPEMRVAGPAESAAMIRKILAGHRGPARDIVVINAAAALWTVGKDPSLDGCARLAARAIDSGAAADLLARLVAMTHARSPLLRERVRVRAAPPLFPARGGIAAQLV